MTWTSKYARIISHYPVAVLLVSVLLLIVSFHFSGMIKNEAMDYRSMLPDDEPVIAASNYFADTFGSSDSAMIVIQIDPKMMESNEVHDIRDPRVLLYAEQIKEYIGHSSNQIESVSSPVDTLKLMNDGRIPRSIDEVKKLEERNELLSQSISDDKQMMIVSLQLYESFTEGDVVMEINEVLDNVKAPPGLLVQGAGEVIADSYVDSQLGSDMSRTSMVSLGGIVVILIIVFGSLKYGFLPLVTLMFGVMWTFGFIGASGITMSSATSGVLSMIMGIGIDFGIQIITRFRLEKADKDDEEAMFTTLKHTVVPMMTTTIAAIIGFRTMALGDISIMAAMGTMMMYGVIFCFFAAITVVPALTIIIERITAKTITTKSGKKYKLR